MLSLPTTIFEELIRDPYRTPLDLLEIVGTTRDNYDLQIDHKYWWTVINWCTAATQAGAKTHTSSMLAIKLDAVAQEDESFHMWCTSR